MAPSSAACKTRALAPGSRRKPPRGVSSVRPDLARASTTSFATCVPERRRRHARVGTKSTREDAQRREEAGPFRRLAADELDVFAFTPGTKRSACAAYQVEDRRSVTVRFRHHVSCGEFRAHRLRPSAAVDARPAKTGGTRLQAHADDDRERARHVGKRECRTGKIRRAGCAANPVRRRCPPADLRLGLRPFHAELRRSPARRGGDDGPREEKGRPMEVRLVQTPRVRHHDDVFVYARAPRVRDEASRPGRAAADRPAARTRPGESLGARLGRVRAATRRGAALTCGSIDDARNKRAVYDPSFAWLHRTTRELEQYARAVRWVMTVEEGR